MQKMAQVEYIVNLMYFAMLIFLNSTEVSPPENAEDVVSPEVIVEDDIGWVHCVPDVLRFVEIF